MAQYSTFIKTFEAITVQTRRGEKVFKNVIRFNLDKRQVNLSEAERDELNKAFAWNKTDKYYFATFKTKKDMNAMYKTLLDKYGEYFNASADEETAEKQAELKAEKKTVKKSAKKETAKKESKKETVKKTVKIESKKEVKEADDLGWEAVMKEVKEHETKEDEKTTIKGYDWEDVIKNQMASIDRLTERVIDNDNKFEKLLALLYQQNEKIERLENRIEAVAC